MDVYIYICAHVCIFTPTYIFAFTRVRLFASAYHRQKFFQIKFVIYNNFMQHIKNKATVANAR